MIDTLFVNISNCLIISQKINVFLEEKMAKRKLGAIYGLLFAIAAALMCAFALTFDIPAEYASA